MTGVWRLPRTGYPVHKRILHKGLIVEVVYEEEVGPWCDPRDADCHIGTMFCWHPDYTLGDEQFKGHTFDCPTCDRTGVIEQWAVVYDWPSNLGEVARFLKYDDAIAFRNDLPPANHSYSYGVDQLTCPRCEGEGEIYIEDMRGVAKWLEESRKAIHILPLSLIDHSGISMSVGTSFGCDPGGWDTSLVGFIYTTQEKLDEVGCPPEIAEQGLRDEVKTYDAYLRGEVYYFMVKERTSPTEDPEHEDYIEPEDDGDGEALDSCGGFVGDEEGCEEAGKESAEGERETLDKEECPRDLLERARRSDGGVMIDPATIIAASRANDSNAPVSTVRYLVEFVLNEEFPDADRDPTGHMVALAEEIQRALDETSFLVDLRYNAIDFEVQSRTVLDTAPAGDPS